MQSLPNELIDIIAESLPMRDRCCFALTHQSIYNRNKYVLKWYQKHRQCMQAVSSIKYLCYDDVAARTLNGNITIIKYNGSDRHTTEIIIKNYCRDKFTIIQCRTQNVSIIKQHLSRGEGFGIIASIGKLIQYS